MDLALNQIDLLAQGLDYYSRTIGALDCCSVKYMVMTDPKDKDPQERKKNKDRVTEAHASANDSNWNAHQQIDEEGYEISPDTIK